MANQVYNVGEQGNDLLVKSLNPLETTSDIAQALEYDTSTDAASIATYLNSLNNGKTYVVVGPHPKPR